MGPSALSKMTPHGVLESPHMKALRSEVRGFLQKRLASGDITPGVDTWLTYWDSNFSRDLAHHGYLGMTIPTEYGGGGRTHLERFVVTEELLAVGAPVAAHWIADRQIAPSLLTFGTEEQKRRFLPAIARGECFFGIGMSEPDSGSDLASVRTQARQVAGGWHLTGSKVWTSGAHHADAFFALARTAPLNPDRRHDGLSQFIVDLRAPGVSVQPIVSMSGSHHFNEVHLDDVFISDRDVLGSIGDGWKQVTSELGYERSGPERFMSTFMLFDATVHALRREASAPSLADVGQLTARLNALHQMSFAVSGALEAKENADTAAAVVKVLGTQLEGSIAEIVDLNVGGAQDMDSTMHDYLQSALEQRPGFTLRGGTSEILKSVIVKGLRSR